MLFNSYFFIFCFLPTAFLIFYAIGLTRQKTLVKLFLVFASLFFYGFFNWNYLYLIAASLLINYVLINGVRITRKRILLCAGIVFNVGVISYFKYYNFFLSNINAVFDIHLPYKNIFLPLAISFFTLQKIAFLIDAYRGKVEAFSFLDYCCFVLFFPQLIAGPIVLPKEIFPQINAQYFGRWNWPLITEGFVLFWVGMAKKVLVADSLAPWAETAFNHTGNVSFVDAWVGALAFAFQIYFDFSGYSDMAIGLGKMFGINLPINFRAPYSACDIRDFWKRWHMTLSRFLREYLYFSLGGNRLGALWQYRNIMIVMLIGGLWHGAKWNFIIWGGIHAIYICLNHMTEKLKFQISPWLSRIVTFIAVVLAWVFFRAGTFTDAINMLKGMLGMHGFDLSMNTQYLVLILIYLVTVFEERIEKFFRTKVSGHMCGAVAIGLAMALGIIFIKRTSSFLYFQF